MEKFDIGDFGGKGRYIKGMGKSFFKAVIYTGIAGFVRMGVMLAGWVICRIMADVGELDGVLRIFYLQLSAFNLQLISYQRSII